jgi:hypothetical protein
MPGNWTGKSSVLMHMCRVVLCLLTESSLAPSSAASWLGACSNQRVSLTLHAILQLVCCIATGAMRQRLCCAAHCTCTPCCIKPPVSIGSGLGWTGHTLLPGMQHWSVTCALLLIPGRKVLGRSACMCRPRCWQVACTKCSWCLPSMHGQPIRGYHAYSKAARVPVCVDLQSRCIRPLAVQHWLQEGRVRVSLWRCGGCTSMPRQGVTGGRPQRTVKPGRRCGFRVGEVWRGFPCCARLNMRWG